MAPRKQPRRWLEFALETYPPSSPGVEIYKWAQRPYAGSRFVEGRVAVHGWEIIRRALSSMTGEPHIDSASVLLQDNDGLIRELLDTQWFLNREGLFHLLSEAGWNLNLEPRRLFGGQCYDVQPVDHRMARIEFEDVLAKYLDRQYPQYTIADAYPDAEDDLKEQVLPLVWGPHEDQGIMDLTAGRVVRKGLLPTYLVQMATLEGSPGSSGLFTRNGIDIGMGLSCRYVNVGAFPTEMGIIGFMYPINPSDGTLHVQSVQNRQAPINAFDPETGTSIQPPGETWLPRYVFTNLPGITEYLLVIAGPTYGNADPSFDPFDWPTRCAWARYKVIGPSDYIVADPAVGGAIHWEYWVDGGPYDWGDDWLALQYGSGGSPGLGGMWGELLVSEYVIPITTVYGSDLGATAQATLPEADDGLGLPASTPIRVPLAAERFGVDVLAPGHPGWPFSEPYVTRNGHRLTVIYAKGALLDHHRNGVISITVDACGVLDDLAQDGSGNPIDQAAFMYQDFLSEVVFANDGAGTKGGPKAGLPTFGDGRPMFWTSRIQSGQAQTAARLGNAKGYMVSMALHEPMTLRDWLRHFHVTFGAFTGRNHHGQIVPLWIPDDAYDAASGKAVRERIELETLPAPYLDHRSIENEMESVYGWDPELKTWRTAPRVIRDQASIDALKGDVRRGIRRELRFTADDATAVDVMQRLLLLLSQAPRTQRLPVRTQGVDIELGDVLRVSHRDGLGPRGVGYLERPFLVIGHEHVGNSVTVIGLDIERMLEP